MLDWQEPHPSVMLPPATPSDPIQLVCRDGTRGAQGCSQRRPWEGGAGTDGKWGRFCFSGAKKNRPHFPERSPDPKRPGSPGQAAADGGNTPSEKTGVTYRHLPESRYLRRCRMTSKKKTAAAAATLSEPTLPARGMARTLSQVLRTRGRRPRPSEPRTMPTGPG